MRRLNIILVWHLYIFLLFAGLLLLVFVPVYQYIAAFTLRNELAHIESRMKQGIETVDAVIVAMNNEIRSTSADSRFRALAFMNSAAPPRINPWSLRELRDALNIPLLPYALVADAGLVFPGGRAVTRHGIFYYPDTVSFYGAFLRCGELSGEEWTALLAAEYPAGQSFIPARNYSSAYYPEYEAVTYAARWAYAGFPEAIIFFAALPVGEIVSLVAGAEQAGYIRMYDAEGAVLFSRENPNTAITHTVVYQSPSNLLRYEIGISSAFINEKMRPVRNRALVFIGLTSAFVLLLSFLFAWYGSRPERAFFERVRSARGIIRLEPERAERELPFNVFKGMKRTYHDLAETIYAANSRLETSLRTIEGQTRLIQIQTIDKIRQALAGGNEAAACFLLRDCAGALSRPLAPLITGLLAEMLSGMLREMALEYPAISAVTIPEYTPGMEDDLFEHQYPACFSQIGEALRAHHEKTIPALGREVLAYINEHLYNPALYSTMAADHFGISAPTLQKLVKQCTGQTFLNYVEKRRLERACELLSGGRDNIVHIAQSCGFSSANSFSRSFKRVYGCSPGKLRNSRP
jgi:AraC-like DNA-binding protein